MPPSLSDRVATALRKKILKNFHPGERLPTIRQLAREFDVSVNTVHHGFAVLRREGLVEGWAGSGMYVCEPTIDQHVALVIGLSELCPRLNYYPGCILTGTMAALQQQGIAYRTYWDIEGIPTGSPKEADGDNTQSFWRNVYSGRVSVVGIIQTFRDDENNRRLDTCEVPVVWNTRAMSDQCQYLVTSDWEYMFREGIASLVRSGSRRIAIMAWDEDNQIVSGRHPRITSFQKLYSEQGLMWRPEWIRGSLHPSLRGAGYAEFREIWTSSRDKPDGLLILDDHLLSDVALAIRELNIRVPKDLTVVATVNKGGTACCHLPTTLLIIDPLANAEEMGGMLATLARKETPAKAQVFIPFERCDAPEDAVNDLLPASV